MKFTEHLVSRDRHHIYARDYTRAVLTIRRDPERSTGLLPNKSSFSRVRIVFGGSDPYLNRGVAEAFHALLPTSDLFLLPSARHFVQMDEPEAVARLILSTPLHSTEA